MALTACKECGKEISTEAAACPHCGAKPAKTSGCAIVIIAVIMLGILGSIVNGYEERKKADAESSRVASLTPEERALEERRAAIQAASKAREEAAFQKVVGALITIRQANRNPASVTWESIRANGDASVICVEYRGQNGFGGMSKEFVVYVKDAPSQKSAAWNKHCTQPLNDMISARQAVR